MATNISTNNISATLTIGTIPITLDNFSTDSDILTPNEVQTAEMAVTPDGKSVAWNMNAIYTFTITFNGASVAAKLLRETIRNQTRIAGKPSVSIPITLTIINDDRIETFLDGRVTNGTPSLGYGNQKLLDQTFTLKFSQVVSN